LFAQRPEYFSYSPQVADKRHPLPSRFNVRRDLPHIHLAALRSSSDPDTIVGFGSPAAAVRLAEAFLNATHASTIRDEFDFESELGGFEAVAPGSAELRLFLPGSVGYRLAHQGLD
jgi:hypothetical protein